MSEEAPRLRIGEVAERTGTTTRTIRYYEEIGLLPGGDARSPGAHRTYGEDDVERLRETLRLKEVLGLSLDELRELGATQNARAALRSEWHEGVDDPVRRREILDEALGHIDRQLKLVRRRKREIEALEDRLAIKRAEVSARRREQTPSTTR
jgi:DNA-binding transcriptional MerR regulator